jgi:ABC transporter substrate binding protein (PQQ-dependent alcohol dehydrogenase system)
MRVPWYGWSRAVFYARRSISPRAEKRPAATSLLGKTIVICLIVGISLARGSAPAYADDTSAHSVDVGYLTQVEKREAPFPFLDAPPADEGLAGARLAIADNNTTGKFTGQSFVLKEFIVPEAGDPADALRQAAGAGIRFLVTDFPAEKIVALAALPEAAGMTIFNAGAPDDALRAEQCRANLLHTIPSRAMLADALVQYLVSKRWAKILLAVGPTDGDRLYADAIERSAHKFQAHIVERKSWTFQAGAKRTDTGHFAIEAEVARFTQGIDYDVLVVADETDDFGDSLPYHTFDPRPIAGTAGLVATGWARPFQQWGATQLQNRFLRLANRWMTSRDFAAWTAVRAVGEAATRTNSTDPDTMAKFMRSDKFELAVYKGAKSSFRPWDGQLRQPVLLADERQLVSVSPQPGFLHQFNELDTLGIDEPETKCHLK